MKDATKIIKAFPTELKVEEGERAVTARISTISVDRDGEILTPQGCVSKNYERNPIVLYQHNSFGLPIGKCVSLTRDEKSITAKTVFAERPATYPADSEWLPDTVLSLFQQGVLKAFSVGFSPIDMPHAPTAKETEKYGDGVRRVFGKWELLEYSVVTIPANQDAVAVAVSKSADAMRQFITPPPEVKPMDICTLSYGYILEPPAAEPIERPTRNLKAEAFASAIKAVRKAKGYVYPI